VLVKGRLLLKPWVDEITWPGQDLPEAVSASGWHLLALYFVVLFVVLLGQGEIVAGVLALVVAGCLCGSLLGAKLGSRATLAELLFLVVSLPVLAFLTVVGFAAGGVFIFFPGMQAAIGFGQVAGALGWLGWKALHA
jgi:hypothetical protein